MVMVDIGFVCFVIISMPKYQMSVYKTFGPLFILWHSLGLPYN